MAILKVSFKLSLKVCSPPIRVSWIEQLDMVCKSFFGSWQQDGNRQRCGNCPLGLANSLRRVAPANWLIWVSTQWEECPLASSTPDLDLSLCHACFSSTQCKTPVKCWHTEEFKWVGQKHTHVSLVEQRVAGGKMDGACI